MNPIPLNDRGQFRYTDFINYIPEFLWDEPDVVQLVQLMSDYINDAYRNIEDVEEFEFKLCVHEARVDRAIKKLENLASMFRLASGRGERVYYLSVPRANVKTNTVFGKNTGYTPYYVDVGLSEIQDEITGVSRFDRKIEEMDDGDVVYVRYTSMDPVIVRPYYYSAERHSLLKEPEGSSQDPFTDTANTGSRMISFLVDDISSVSKRFGADSGYNSYYEVFFTARVSHVEDAAAVEKLRFDADRIDGADDDVIVDYYGIEYVPRGKYHASISFYGNDGWKWKSGMPAGLFYLKDSSGAKLSAVGNALAGNEEMPVDPTVSREMLKFALAENAVYEESTGMWKFVTETALPQSDGGRFYLIKKRDGSLSGEFTCMPGTSLDGKYGGYMTAVWLDDGDAESFKADEYMLMTFSLFYDKGMPDYTTYQPKLSWTVISGDETLDWENSTLVRCTEENIVKLGSPFNLNTETDVNPDDPREMYIPPDVYEAFLAYDGPSNLYSSRQIWNTNGVPVWYSVNPSFYRGNPGGGAISLSVMVNDGEYNDVQLSAGLFLDVYADGKTLHINNNPDESDFWNMLDGMVSESAATATGCLACRSGDDMYYVMITGTDKVDSTVELNMELPTGTYSAEIVHFDTAGGRIVGIDGITAGAAGQWSGNCIKYSGDIYTDGLFFAHDRAGRYAFVKVSNGTGIMEFAPNANYVKNDMVFWNKRIYRCVANCTPAEGDTPESMESFRQDMTYSAHVEYAPVYNKFMPYYGPVKAMEYGGKVEYSDDMSTASLPLYITKVVENRLRYGWEHREFVNYGTMMAMGGRNRNGSVDVYSVANPQEPDSLESKFDVVTATLSSKARWSIDYPVVKRGVARYAKVDIDNPSLIPVERTENGYTVTMTSAGHGLVDGCMVRVSGYTVPAAGVNINGYYTIHAIDGDTFSYEVSIPGSGATGGMVTYIPVSDTNRVDYVGDYRMDVVEVEKTGDTAYTVHLVDDPVGIKTGDRLYLVDLDVDAGLLSEGASEFTVEIAGIGDMSLQVICAEDALEKQASHSFHLRRAPETDDFVICDSVVYRVSGAEWTEMDNRDLAVPSVLMSKNNLMDISKTNPEFALGKDMTVVSLEPAGIDGAVVTLKDGIPHFTADNAGIIENRTMVMIRNATPAAYNGWHTVTKVYSPKRFAVTMRLPVGSVESAIGINGKDIILNEGRWYAFTIQGMDWDKVSNRTTFSLDNEVKGAEGELVVTTREHGVSVGDYVVIGQSGIIAGITAGSSDTGIKCYRVAAVPGKFSIRLESIDGSPVNVSASGKESVARGVLLTDRMDDLGSLRNEYTRTLCSIGGKPYRFRAGDIVVALAQQNPSEVKTWRVEADAPWCPVKPKRVMKISGLGVYSYDNGNYGAVDAEEGIDTEVYETYSDVDVSGFNADVYLAGFRSVRHPNFQLPALSEMDTTRGSQDYSSGEDYSNVAPRTDMKSSFRGVPPMKYPLVEKIERLCYLRDANVIDFELIEYLARFLGYDITALGDDVTESSLYNTRKERELAIRETVANLPQYYSLGGTKAGLHMLMSTFGVISDAITLWTDAEHPYRELISQEEVKGRYESGSGGKWVPTPYIDIEITNHAEFPQLAIRMSDIERIKEQIRVFKPINVVFRDFIYQLVDTAKLKVGISIVDMSGSYNLGAISASGEVPEVDYGSEELTNCAF